MTSVKVRRLASNPRRKRSVARYRPAAKRVKARARNPKRHARRTLSAKQIKFFGTASQRAALKRKRKRKVSAAPVRRRRVAKANPVRRRRRVAVAAPRKRRRRVAKANPVRRRRRAVAAAPVRRRRRRASANPVRRRKARRRSNPALVLTLGAINPRRRTMKRRKRHSTVARRRRANPSRITVRARSRNAGRRRHVRRRNPGMGSGINLVTSIGGGLLGVTIAKAGSGLLPASMQSPIMRIVAAAGAGYAGKMLAHKMHQPALGDAILFGALMQAGSTALNTWLPSIGGQIGLNGLGDLVPTPNGFAVPHPFERKIPVGMQAMLPPVQGVAGVRRAFPAAF